MEQSPDQIFDDASGDLAVGDLESAAAKYRRCVEIAPDFFDGWHALGMALMKLGRFNEAIEAERPDRLDEFIAILQSRRQHQRSRSSGGEGEGFVVGRENRARARLSSKSQAPSSKEAVSFNLERGADVICLNFSGWNFPGVWVLGFGFSRVSACVTKY